MDLYDTCLTEITCSKDFPNTSLVYTNGPLYLVAFAVQCCWEACGHKGRIIQFLVAFAPSNGLQFLCPFSQWYSNDCMQSLHMQVVQDQRQEQGQTFELRGSRFFCLRAQLSICCWPTTRTRTTNSLTMAVGNPISSHNIRHALGMGEISWRDARESVRRCNSMCVLCSWLAELFACGSFCDGGLVSTFSYAFGLECQVYCSNAIFVTSTGGRRTLDPWIGAPALPSDLIWDSLRLGHAPNPLQDWQKTFVTFCRAETSHIRERVRCSCPFRHFTFHVLLFAMQGMRNAY